jgi:hypothetical protein
MATKKCDSAFSAGTRQRRRTCASTGERSAALLQVQELSKTFASLKGLDALSTQVDQGES